MIDIKKHYYNMGNEDINMMVFGDLHIQINLMIRN